MNHYMTPGGRIIDSAPFPHRTWRPVVVIDPEDREAVERLFNAVAHAYDADPADAAPGYDVTIYQRGLRSLIAPPKPEEPQGLGAVVEATCGCSTEPRKFVRDPDARDFNLPWDARNVATGNEVPWVARCGHHPYADLAAVRVLSEGVTP